jgi:N4-gp56 family major capsid protein
MNTNRNLIRVNLQQFANPNTNVTTDTGLTNEMKTFYEKMLIKTAEEELLFDQFGQKKPIPAHGGRTIEFRKYSPFAKALTPLTEGVTPDGHKITMSTITATAAQFGDYVTLSDRLILEAIDDNIVEATELSGSQAGRTLDTVTRDIVSAGTNVLYAPAGTTAVTTRANLTTASLITSDLILKAATILRTNIAKKIDGNYVGIVHPHVAEILKKDPKFIAWNQYTTPEKYWKGEIGSIHGVRIIENAEAKIINDNTCPVKTAASGNDPATYYSVYATVIFGADAYGVTEIEGGGLQHIVKQLGSGDDPLNQRATVGWKATKTAERLVDAHIVRIESLTEFSATQGAN